MSQGRTCEIHNEFCPDGNCRWCEPLDPVSECFAELVLDKAEDVQPANDEPPGVLVAMPSPPYWKSPTDTAATVGAGAGTGWQCAVNGHIFTVPIDKCKVCGASLPFNINPRTWQSWHR